MFNNTYKIECLYEDIQNLKNSVRDLCVNELKEGIELVSEVIANTNELKLAVTVRDSETKAEYYSESLEWDDNVGLKRVLSNIANNWLVNEPNEAKEEQKVVEPFKDVTVYVPSENALIAMSEGEGGNLSEGCEDYIYYTVYDASSLEEVDGGQLDTVKPLKDEYPSLSLTEAAGDIVEFHFGVKGLPFYVLSEETPILTSADIFQLNVRYKNAKTMAKHDRNEGDPKWMIEYGRAEALEGVLRLLGNDVMEVASGALFGKEVF